MQFSITVQSAKHHAVNIDTEKLGIAALDRVREELKTPKLSAKLLEPEIRGMHEDFAYLNIPEAIARESGHFRCRTHICVHVPPGFLNELTETKVTAIKDPGTDEIQSVRIRRTIDDATIIRAWDQAGYPRKWSTPEPGQDGPEPEGPDDE